ncbi:hypothetical protein LMG1861_05069 [Achromobacter piechaudii]|uniref:Uncharacterized protein n=1 Tax=Achromobacter piechaudii TaxID=72556 RepID=A0A6S7EPX5_9BURK|nr:hypothetical protein LMG1861_05069 [Achromobacter piechaudii]
MKRASPSSTSVTFNLPLAVKVVSSLTVPASSPALAGVIWAGSFTPTIVTSTVAVDVAPLGSVTV